MRCAVPPSWTHTEHVRHATRARGEESGLSSRRIHGFDAGALSAVRAGRGPRAKGVYFIPKLKKSARVTPWRVLSLGLGDVSLSSKKTNLCQTFNSGRSDIGLRYTTCSPREAHIYIHASNMGLRYTAELRYTACVTRLNCSIRMRATVFAARDAAARGRRAEERA